MFCDLSIFLLWDQHRGHIKLEELGRSEHKRNNYKTYIKEEHELFFVKPGLLSSTTVSPVFSIRPTIESPSFRKKS
jgi:hypothetical protein